MGGVRRFEEEERGEEKEFVSECAAMDGSIERGVLGGIHFSSFSLTC